MPRQVDYYFSFQSPWAYIGHKSFREVANTYDLKVNHKPVVLVDLFSETGGLPLMKRHPVRQRYRMVELQRWRDKRGLKFHLQPANWPFNARLADGVVIAALEAGHDPDPYLRAVERSGVGHEACMAIEDSERGLESATRAGVRCIVVPSELTRGGRFLGAHRVIGSVSDVPMVL